MFKNLNSSPSIFVSACVFNSTEIGRTKEKFSDFFFVSKLILLLIDSARRASSYKKKIADEKRNRKFNCSEFQNFK